MRKILPVFLHSLAVPLGAVIAFAMFYGCATWSFDGATTVQVKDKSGNTYTCNLNYADDAKQGECSFYIQKGIVVYKCTLGIEKRENFTVEQDCTIEITLEPAEEPKEDQACHLPKNHTDAFHSRTI